MSASNDEPTSPPGHPGTGRSIGTSRAKCQTSSPIDPLSAELLALYNLAYIAPLVGLLLVVSDRRTLGRLGRWNGANSPWVKAGLALVVVAMSFGLLYTL